MWTDVDDTRSALQKGERNALARRFSTDDPAHQRTLLALTSDERRMLFAHERMLAGVGALALRWVQAGRLHDGLALFDDAIEVPRGADLSLYCNALWAVMDDNHHAGIMPERAGRYLARCLRHAPQNPAIFFNAACVALELGDRETALEHVRDAVRFGYEPLELIRAEPFLAPLHGDPRFARAFDDPIALAARAARWLPSLPAEAKVDWSRVFESAQPARGATEAELTILREAWRPLCDDDAPWLAAPGELDRARGWALAGALPPASYLDFLRFSNGGTFGSGERRFSSFFEVHTLRGMMLGYGIPEEMPSVFPFAFDGGGVFYAFDMREPPQLRVTRVVGRRAGRRRHTATANRPTREPLTGASRLEQA